MKTSKPTDIFDHDALHASVPYALARTGWHLTLELGMTMTTLALELLQAQQRALQGVASAQAAPLAPAGARLTIGDIYQRVAAAGYSAISEIEWEDDYYEVEARNSQGQAVELRVHGRTGQIEDVKRDD